MEASTTTPSWRTRLDPAGIAAWLLGAAPVLYLGFENGGFDPDQRGAAGLLVWWILLLAAAAGLIPSLRQGRSPLVLVGLLAAFALWTGLAAGWSESSERTVIELARVVTYLGLFILALVAVSAGRWREL